MCTKNNTTDVSPAILLLLFMHPSSSSGAENRVHPLLNLTAGYVTDTARLTFLCATCYHDETMLQTKLLQVFFNRMFERDVRILVLSS